MTDNGDMMKRQGKPAHYGRPGRSATVAGRGRWASLAGLSKKSRFSILFAATMFGLLLGTAGTGTPRGALTGAAIAAGVTLVTGALLLAPGLLATLTVVLVTVTFLPYLGSLYTWAAAGAPDMVGGAVALFVMYALCLWIVMRWGRGRSWVSALLVSGSILVPGIFLLMAFPSAGLNAARVSMLAVTLVRCGAIGWIASFAALLWEKVTSRESALDVVAGPVDLSTVSSAWERRAHAEKATAALLANLPADYATFHDVNVPKSPTGIGHLVVGPSGVFVISSVVMTDVAFQDKDRGLVMPGVDVGDLAWRSAQVLQPLCKALRVRSQDVTFVVATHGGSLPSVRTVFDAYVDGGSVTPLVRLVVVPADALTDQIADGFQMWTAVKTRQTARRARVKLSPAVLPAARKFPASPDRMVLTEIDSDGKVSGVRVEGAVSAAEGLQLGDSVEATTTVGLIKGLRVAGPSVTSTSGEMMVPVCDELAFSMAGSSTTGKAPDAYLLPLSCLRKVESPAG